MGTERRPIQLLSAVGRRLGRTAPEGGGAAAGENAEAEEDWLTRASAIAPLLRHADDSFGGEAGIIEKIFEVLPERAGYAVEFGQRAIGTGTVAKTVAERGWGALYMDREPAQDLETQQALNGRTITLAREDVGPDNINELFAKHGVPKELDCLVIDIDGLDFWVWDAIDEHYSPSLVIVEFNAHVAPGVEATIHRDPEWSFGRDKNYGASLAAFDALAARRGYRLVHVHGCWNLYFVRDDLGFPSTLTVRMPLGPAEIGLLTKTAPFYDALCGGDRPSWFGTPPPDVAIAPWEILADAGETTTVDLEGLELDVIAEKHDASWYLQRPAFEEKSSRLYPLIADAGFRSFVDVGANAGLVSILARDAAPGLRSVAIEADPRLVRLLRRNLARHGLGDADVITAIAGSEEASYARFSLNPDSSLDNRVVAGEAAPGEQGWPAVHVPVVTLARVLETLQVEGPVFFKVDTQGFEQQVLAGAEPWLTSHDDWLIKMEFAPHWLRSQGTDPAGLLRYIDSLYEIGEFPARIGFVAASLAEQLPAPLQAAEALAFTEHVTRLDRRGRGWVDVYVRPRAGATA